MPCLTFVSLSAGNHTRPKNPCRIPSLKMPFVTLYICINPLLFVSSQSGRARRALWADSRYQHQLIWSCHIRDATCLPLEIIGYLQPRGQRGDFPEPMVPCGPCRTLCQSGHKTPSKTKPSGSSVLASYTRPGVNLIETII